MSGNRFGYFTDGTPAYTQTGQFGQWDKTGYNFLGWAETKDATTSKYPAYCTVANEWIEEKYPSISLYGVWSPKTFTVSFNANSGVVTQTTKTVTYDSTYGNLPVPTKIGHTFVGWYLKKSLEIVLKALFVNIC